MSATYEGLIKFVPVRHGKLVSLGDAGLLGVSGRHKLIGFKPAPGKKREGWLVFLVRGLRDAPHFTKKRSAKKG